MSESKKVLAIIIGDGFIDKKGRIRLHHSLSQKEWLLKKVQILQEEGFKVKVFETQQMSFGKIRPFIKAETTATTRGKKLRNLFYPEGIKILNEDILKDFGFEEWAIIFQDDGRQNKISHYNILKNGERIRVECEPFVNRYEIAVDCFDDNSIEILRDSLRRLNIESNVMRKKNGKPILCITRAESKIRFYEGIKPYVIDSMQYKLSAKPTLSYKHTP